MEIKTDFKEKAKPKVGSKDNMTYQPGELSSEIISRRNERESRQTKWFKKSESVKLDLEARLSLSLKAWMLLHTVCFSLSQAVAMSRYIMNLRSLRKNFPNELEIFSVMP